MLVEMLHRGEFPRLIERELVAQARADRDLAGDKRD